MKQRIFSCLLLLSLTCYGQGPGMQAMIKQIALVQIYIGYLQKGYSIAQKGLNTISDIRNGHWQLDIAFFERLNKINPAIAGYGKVAEILRLQQAVLHRCRELKKLTLHQDEAGYIEKVTELLAADVETILRLLNMLISNNQLKMDDGARIESIETIYAGMNDKYSFITGFLNDAKLLLLNRTKEQNDLRTLSLLTNGKY